MKIVYSLWLKPVYDRWDYEGLEPNIDKLNASINCLTLSILTMKKYGFKVEVVTDKKGKELIKGLPIDKTTIELERLKYNGKTWVEGKLVAIAKQKEPFVHVDWDVFFLDHKIANIIRDFKEDVIIQNREEISVYGEGFESSFMNFIDKTKKEGINVFKHELKHAFCCGIVGFNNLKLRDKWVSEFKKCLKVANEFEYDSSLIIEQCLLYAIVLNQGYKYRVVLPEKRINSTAKKIGYTHLIFLSKYTSEYQTKIKRKIKKEFPKYQTLLK